MEKLIEKIRNRASSLSLTVAVVLIALQLLLPSLFDFLLTAMVFGLGWLGGKLGDRE